MFVTDDVSNSGTDVSEAHAENIPPIVVTDDVSNSGTDGSERQLKNMLVMFVTEDVSKNETDVSERQLPNISTIEVPTTNEPDPFVVSEVAVPLYELEILKVSAVALTTKYRFPTTGPVVDTSEVRIIVSPFASP